MKFMCHECYMKLTTVERKAWDEVNLRLDSGECVEDLYVEYCNEKRLLGSEDERYWFLRAASDYCIRSMGLSQVHKAGWRMNRSGRWVQRESKALKERSWWKKPFWKG